MFNTENYEVAPGINYEYVYIAGDDPLQPTLLFLHGFPSSYYCWRHQIKYFSGKGYSCLAPNLMGYGKTYSPSDKNEYRAKSMVQHLISLLDHLSIEQVIVIGHDWGVRPASRFILHQPTRALGLVLVSVGYMPPREFDFQAALTRSKQALGYENIGYWEFFTSDDAVNLIQQNIDSFIDIGYTDDPNLWKTDFAPLGKIRAWIAEGKTAKRASFITDEDVVVLKQLVSEALEAKLNWYKSVISNIDWEDEKSLDPKIDCPVLFIGGQKDFICIPQLYNEQANYIANLQTVNLETSHWIMEQQPDTVNQTIENWIDNMP